MGFYDIGAGIGPDIEGDDELMLGAQYLLGGASPQSVAQLAAAKAAGKTLVKSGNFSKGRYLVMGFPTTAVAAAPAAANITTQPQKVMRPIRFVLPDSIAEAFLINQLLLANLPQFVSVDPVPGGVFKSSAVGVALRMDTISPGNNATVNVSNITGGALNFNGALIGDTVE